MKHVQSLPITFAMTLLLGASCGEAKVHAGNALDQATAAVKEIDLSKMTPEAMKTKVNSLVSDVARKLTEIKDQASAKDVAAYLDPLVNQLKQLKSALGANMPDMTSLKTAVEDLKTRFANNQAVQDVLKPLMDKIKSLVQ